MQMLQIVTAKMKFSIWKFSKRMKYAKICFVIVLAVHKRKLARDLITWDHESIFTAMTSNKFDTLQYVFACLSTHSRWVKIIKNDFSQLTRYFHLSLEDRNYVQKMFNSDFNRIWAAACLLEEKRWREILPSIKCTLALVGQDKLKLHWYEYLNMSDLKDNIPKSPILESTEFLRYMLVLCLDSSHKGVFEYERLRNSILSYEFNIIEEVCYINFASKMENLCMYQAKVNPSYITKKIDISLVKLIKNTREQCNENLSRMNTVEEIGFYKDTNTGKVRSIQLNEKVKSILSKLSESENVLICLDKIMSIVSMRKADAMCILEKMYKEGLIYFIMVK